MKLAFSCLSVLYREACCKLGICLVLSNPSPVEFGFALFSEGLRQTGGADIWPFSLSTTIAFAKRGTIELKANHRSMQKHSADPTRPRVLIADDHLIFAKTLGGFLEKSFTVIGVVTDGRAMVDEVIKQRPDVVVSDIGMPLMNGLEAARRIKELAPEVKFVFLTMQDDPNLAAAALELGPVAFVLKHYDEQELLKALTLVLHGKSYVRHRLGRKIG